MPGDLTVGGTSGRQADDLEFLGGEPAERIGSRTARGDFTRRPQLIARTVGPRSGLQAFKSLERRSQLRPSVGRSAAPPKPLAVEQMRTCPLERTTALGVQSYGSRVMLLHLGWRADQRTAPFDDPRAHG